MTFIDDEQSIHDGEPVELYKFVGSATTFFLTSHVEDVLFMGDTYIREAAHRTTISSEVELNRSQLEIRVPISEALAQAYSFGNAPRELELTIIRLHPFTGNNEQIWQGKCVAASVEGRTAAFLSTTLLSNAIETLIPRQHYQFNCNHRFGDDRCGIVLTNQTNGVVAAVSISSDGVTIGLSKAIPGPKDWATGGELVRLVDEERRLITASEGKTLSINWPFVTLDVSDSVTIFRGCDHTLATCHNTFDNRLSFGGYPYIPARNIFRKGMKVGAL